MSIQTATITVNATIKTEEIKFVYRRDGAVVEFQYGVFNTAGQCMTRVRGLVPADVAIPYLLANLPAPIILFDTFDGWLKSQIVPDGTLISNTDVNINP